MPSLEEERGNDHQSGLVSPEARARADLHGSSQSQYRQLNCEVCHQRPLPTGLLSTSVKN